MTSIARRWIFVIYVWQIYLCVEPSYGNGADKQLYSGPYRRDWNWREANYSIRDINEGYFGNRERNYEKHTTHRSFRGLVGYFLGRKKGSHPQIGRSSSWDEDDSRSRPLLPNYVYSTPKPPNAKEQEEDWYTRQKRRMLLENYETSEGEPLAAKKEQRIPTLASDHDHVKYYPHLNTQLNEIQKPTASQDQQQEDWFTKRRRKWDMDSDEETSEHLTGGQETPISHSRKAIPAETDGQKRPPTDDQKPPIPPLVIEKIPPKDDTLILPYVNDQNSPTVDQMPLHYDDRKSPPDHDQQTLTSEENKLLSDGDQKPPSINYQKPQIPPKADALILPHVNDQNHPLVNEQTPPITVVEQKPSHVHDQKLSPATDQQSLTSEEHKRLSDGDQKPPPTDDQKPPIPPLVNENIPPKDDALILPYVNDQNFPTVDQNPSHDYDRKSSPDDDQKSLTHLNTPKTSVAQEQKEDWYSRQKRKMLLANYITSEGEPLAAEEEQRTPTTASDQDYVKYHTHLSIHLNELQKPTASQDQQQEDWLAKQKRLWHMDNDETSEHSTGDQETPLSRNRKATPADGRKRPSTDDQKPSIPPKDDALILPNVTYQNSPTVDQKPLHDDDRKLPPDYDQQSLTSEDNKRLSYGDQNPPRINDQKPQIPPLENGQLPPKANVLILPHVNDHNHPLVNEQTPPITVVYQNPSHVHDQKLPPATDQQSLTSEDNKRLSDGDQKPPPTDDQKPPIPPLVNENIPSKDDALMLPYVNDQNSPTVDQNPSHDYDRKSPPDDDQKSLTHPNTPKTSVAQEQKEDWYSRQKRRMLLANYITSEGEPLAAEEEQRTPTTTSDQDYVKYHSHLSTHLNELQKPTASQDQQQEDWLAKQKRLWHMDNDETSEHSTGDQETPLSHNRKATPADGRKRPSTDDQKPSIPPKDDALILPNVTYQNSPTVDQKPLHNDDRKLPPDYDQQSLTSEDNKRLSYGDQKPPRINDQKPQKPPPANDQIPPKADALILPYVNDQSFPLVNEQTPPITVVDQKQTQQPVQGQNLPQFEDRKPLSSRNQTLPPVYDDRNLSTFAHELIFPLEQIPRKPDQPVVDFEDEKNHNHASLENNETVLDSSLKSATSILKQPPVSEFLSNPTIKTLDSNEIAHSQLNRFVYTPKEKNELNKNIEDWISKNRRKWQIVLDEDDPSKSFAKDHKPPPTNDIRPKEFDEQNLPLVDNQKSPLVNDIPPLPGSKGFAIEPQDQPPSFETPPSEGSLSQVKPLRDPFPKVNGKTPTTQSTHTPQRNRARPEARQLHLRPNTLGGLAEEHNKPVLIGVARAPQGQPLSFESPLLEGSLQQFTTPKDPISITKDKRPTAQSTNTPTKNKARPQHPRPKRVGEEIVIAQNYANFNKGTLNTSARVTLGPPRTNKQPDIDGNRGKVAKVRFDMTHLIKDDNSSQKSPQHIESKPTHSESKLSNPESSASIDLPHPRRKPGTQRASNAKKSPPQESQAYTTHTPQRNRARPEARQLHLRPNTLGGLAEEHNKPVLIGVARAPQGQPLSFESPLLEGSLQQFTTLKDPISITKDNDLSDHSSGETNKLGKSESGSSIMLPHPRRKPGPSRASDSDGSPTQAQQFVPIYKLKAERKRLSHPLEGPPGFPQHKVSSTKITTSSKKSKSLGFTSAVKKLGKLFSRKKPNPNLPSGVSLGKPSSKRLPIRPDQTLGKPRPSSRGSLKPNNRNQPVRPGTRKPSATTEHPAKEDNIRTNSFDEAYTGTRRHSLSATGSAINPSPTSTQEHNKQIERPIHPTPKGSTNLLAKQSWGKAKPPGRKPQPSKPSGKADHKKSSGIFGRLFGSKKNTEKVPPGKTDKAVRQGSKETGTLDRFGTSPPTSERPTHRPQKHPPSIKAQRPNDISDVDTSSSPVPRKPHRPVPAREELLKRPHTPQSPHSESITLPKHERETQRPIQLSEVDTSSSPVPRTPHSPVPARTELSERLHTPQSPHSESITLPKHERETQRLIQLSEVDTSSFPVPRTPHSPVPAGTELSERLHTPQSPHSESITLPERERETQHPIQLSEVDTSSSPVPRTPHSPVPARTELSERLHTPQSPHSESITSPEPERKTQRPNSLSEVDHSSFPVPRKPPTSIPARKELPKTRHTPQRPPQSQSRTSTVSGSTNRLDKQPDKTDKQPTGRRPDEQRQVTQHKGKQTSGGFFSSIGTKLKKALHISPSSKPIHPHGSSADRKELHTRQPSHQSPHKEKQKSPGFFSRLGKKVKTVLHIHSSKPTNPHGSSVETNKLSKRPTDQKTLQQSQTRWSRKPQPAGSRPREPQPTRSRQSVPRPTRSRPTGPQTTKPQSARPRTTGPRTTGSRPTRPRPTGPRPLKSRSSAGD